MFEPLKGQYRYWKQKGREVVDVCGEQRTEEDGKEVMCVNCGFLDGD